MDEYNITYRIQGHRINGILGQRLEETAVTAINNLPGVIVKTSEGRFYSEIYHLGKEEPIARKDMTETMQGLVEIETKEMAKMGRSSFNIQSSPQNASRRS